MWHSFRGLPVGLPWCVCGWLVGSCVLCLVVSGCLGVSCAHVWLLLLGFGVVLLECLGFDAVALVGLVRVIRFPALFEYCLDLLWVGGLVF